MDGYKKLLTVLLLAAMVSVFASPALATSNQMMADKNIVQVAQDSGQFNTLITAVKAADLQDTLSGKGPFTVFAPTDAAFDKLPAGTVQSLVNDKPKLKNILTYHVVPGKLTAADIKNMKTLKTVQGQELKVTVIGDKVMVDGATVTNADIMTNNGVIHVIDKVMMPS
ncbi:fasciclin domain-containing protein [Methanooceanicella nereidis]|uniref:fasciclin domain-containing protein n=1 Tax=Methanooceanicella nereidis TaxID=2052831 RepID=UPI001E4ED73B|nr:fasciclin domain-containing protein [Methanocella sp. CWC-04]